jgi:predicted membrane protein
MARSQHSHHYFWGLILVLLGFLFLLQNLGYLDVDYVLSRYWPVILILIGLRILFNRRETGSTHNSVMGYKQEKEDHAGTSKEKSGSKKIYQQVETKTYNNVFGDIHLRFDNQRLNQFFANNVFGNIDLNFGDAQFENESTIRVSGVFGDIDIILPADVQVQVKANYIGGSSRIFGEHESGLFKNITYSSPASSKKMPVVYLETSHIFGDIRVHN